MTQVQKHILEILGQALGDPKRVRDFSADSELLGGIPELDSMMVVSVVVAIEEQFGLIIDNDEVTAEVFETVGALSDFVTEKLDA